METSAGIDWASETHAVCVVDEHGRRLLQRTIRHDDAGLSELTRLLRQHAVQRVAIERPDGVLVERMLDAGLPVLAIHPNQVQAARDRYRAAGGKSDAFDAFVLAELARTDHHRFRLVRPDSDQTRALQAMTRARDDLVAVRVELANRLRAELERSWPGAAVIFADLDSPIALAFLQRYPSPSDAARLGPQRLAGFLSRHHYCGRKTPAVLLQRLAQAPSVQLLDAESEARRSIVLSLVAALQPLVAQIRELSSAIAQALAAHPDGHIFRAFFRDPKSSLTAATLLAEIGDSRQRYPTADALAADAGQSPVAVESGKRKQATFRRACDKRLRNAISVLADTSRHHNPWAADIYTRARARGASHQHAIRILGRAWCGVIWRLWHDHDIYDPARHTALQRLLTAA
ncbi:MAG: IS110 family transposase [Solirubrobacterales bacterium]|nr:IS110 family transposase [Solirubrobacterales bacterium]